LGAYFLDEAAPGLWRLEIMPDVLFSADPFGKPSLARPMAWIMYSENRKIEIDLPQLGDTYLARRVGSGVAVQAEGGAIRVSPGVYLLATNREQLAPERLPASVGNIGMDEYVMPRNPREVPLHVNHKPAASAVRHNAIRIDAQAFAGQAVDSVVVYPAYASFWNKNNWLYKAENISPYLYRAEIPAADIAGRQDFGYRIVAFSGGEARTFPSGRNGTPLDWDAPDDEASFSVPILDPADPLPLLDASSGTDGAELATIPDSWGKAWLTFRHNAPIGENDIKIAAKPDGDMLAVVTKYVPRHPAALASGKSVLKLRVGECDGIDSLRVMLVDIDGITFGASVRPVAGTTVALPLSEMQKTPTLLVPAPYPSFLKRELDPQGSFRLDPTLCEKFQIAVPFDFNG
ncbi:MAG: hypothetical protein K2O33_09445, partial [Muribaculaceae bacterium]|nr:hypothetical protein [Muribaculaceae bacterium]